MANRKYDYKMTLRYQFNKIDNLKNQISLKVCLIYKMNQILIKIQIFSVIKISMLFILDFGN